MDRTRRWMIGCAALSAAWMTPGCGNGRVSHDGQLSAPESRPLVAREPGPIDEPGAVFHARDLSDRGMSDRPAPRQALHSNWPSTPVTVPATIPMPAVSPASTKRGATSLPTGQYMSLGSVLVQVNGKPIYADKILQALDADLAAKAREMNETEFRRAAAAEIEQEIVNQIKDELVYAAAMEALTPEEKSLAEDLTTQWQQKQIAYAGGSIEEAKVRAAAEGYPFDQQVDDQHRKLVGMMYYEKKIRPRIQVSPQEMRRYYDQHADQFSERAQAQFRVIKFDPKKVGSKEEAKKLANDVLQRAKNGEDFASLAAKYNSDYLARQQGDVGWVERGAYANEKLEQAVWNLQPGGISEVVESDDAFHIAKLENVKTGRTRSFEDPTLQDEVRKTLSSTQAKALQSKDEARLRSQAMIVPEVAPRQLVPPVLEMAMQKYPVWRAR